jgi:hypothetical protein
MVDNDDNLLGSISIRWRAGGVIIAGTAPELHQAIPIPKFARPCRYGRCGSIMFGATETEVDQRLANHLRRCHDE